MIWGILGVILFVIGVIVVLYFIGWKVKEHEAELFANATKQQARNKIINKRKRQKTPKVPRIQR